jgi:calcineurin-like phosphoesterase family protein
MATWFTADLHLGHARIIELCNRPFFSVDQMNEAIINNWNTVVEDGDEVWVLGDVALGAIAETLPLVSRLKGNKMLVPGNHDRCWTGNERVRPVDIERYLDAGFLSIVPGPVLHSEGWLMSHFPYTGDSQGLDRHAAHRPEDRGNWLLHGHVHNEWLVNGRQINVGVDMWNYHPASRAQIRSLMTLADGARMKWMGPVNVWPERQT